MPTHRIRLDAHRHAAFLAEQRKDPITKEPLQDGAEIVICANEKIAFIAGNWLGACPICNCSETLSYIPKNNFPELLGRRNQSQPILPSVLQPHKARLQNKSLWLAITIFVVLLAGLFFFCCIVAFLLAPYINEILNSNFTLNNFFLITKL